MILGDIPRGSFALVIDPLGSGHCLVLIPDSCGLQKGARPSDVATIRLRNGTYLNLPETTTALPVSVRHTVTCEFT